MSFESTRPRYTASQIADAVASARGDSRYFLVTALTHYPGARSAREKALARILDMELRPDERHFALVALAHIRPTLYLRPLIETSLRSRSIGVQQMALAVLPGLAGDGLDDELADEVEGWLRRRMQKRSRSNNAAGWEIPCVALALLPSYGDDRVVKLLSDLEPQMQDYERRHWNEVSAATDDQPLTDLLQSWNTEGGGYSLVSPDERDPTADVVVDRVMKRLGHSPDNPNSAVYDGLADSDIPMVELHVGPKD